MNNAHIIVLVAMVAALALVFYLALGRRKKTALRGLSAYLNGSVHGSLMGHSLRGTFQGLECSIFLFCGSKSSPPSLEISLFKQSSIKMRISRENLLSEVAEKLGIIHDVQTGDTSFDRDFLISSSTPALAEDRLQKGEIKDTIRRLFDEKVAAFTIDYDRVWMEKPNYSIKRDLEPQKVLYYLGELYTLAEWI